MIRAPESPSFAVRRGCDHPGELGLGGAAVHHVVALAQTKTKKSSTLPAAESSKQRAGIGVSHLLLCHRDRSAIHQDAARNSVPFRRRSVRVTSTSPRTARRSGLRWRRRRGDGEGAREQRAGERVHTQQSSTAGRTDADGRRQSKSSLGRGKDRRRKTQRGKRRASC